MECKYEYKGKSYSYSEIREEIQDIPEVKNASDIVYSAESYYSLNLSIDSIYREEIEYYLDGAKTAEETAKILNERISILVEEGMT